MRKTVLAIFGGLFVSIAFAQGSGAPVRVFAFGDGMKFTMRSENNLLYRTKYNLAGKSEIEKLFFGDFNAKVEFFVAPSFFGSYGFRLVNDSIEVKDIPNWKEVKSEMSKKYPTIGMSVSEFKSLRAMPKNVQDSISKYQVQYNHEMWQKQGEEGLKLYEVRTRSFRINDVLAEKIYEKFVSSMNTFEPGGIPRMITDGEYVTFRCVVGDKVQTLTVHQPIREIGKLSDICKDLIKDLTDNNMNESKYIELLDAL